MTSDDALEGQKCSKCKKWFPLTEFAADIARPRGRRSHCQACKSKYDAAYHKRRRERLGPEYRLKKSLYLTGMTVEEFAIHNARTEGRCYVCGELPRSGKRLAVDHCHATGIFRGLLCVRCNTALGLTDDSVERLRALIAYLEAPPLATSASPGSRPRAGPT